MQGFTEPASGWLVDERLRDGKRTHRASLLASCFALSSLKKLEGAQERYTFSFSVALDLFPPQESESERRGALTLGAIKCQCESTTKGGCLDVWTVTSEHRRLPRITSRMLRTVRDQSFSLLDLEPTLPRSAEMRKEDMLLAIGRTDG